MRTGVFIFLRAAGSTLVIGAFAFFVSREAEGPFWFDRAIDFAVGYRMLWVAIFAALAIWDFWFHRPRIEGRNDDQPSDS
jgi:hypothetical protein